MKKLFFVVIFAVTLCFAHLNAQDYHTSVGLRAGWSTGITLKHFVATSDAVEGILTTREYGFNLTGLYERHGRAFDTDHLYYYFGGGAHLGAWRAKPNDNSNRTVIGLSGILGLEYVFTEIPFNISLDWKPAIHLIGHSGFWGEEMALSFRYIF